MRRIITLFIFQSIAHTAFSQADLQTACATSGEGQAGNVIISYTIGDMVLVESWRHQNFLITQGVIQPVREPVNASFDLFTSDEINIYPNPVQDILNVRFGLLYPGSIHISLYDINGKLIQQQTLDYTGFGTQELNMTGYPAATYLLKVIYHPTTGVKKQGGFKVNKIGQ